MARIIKLKESDITNIVRRILREDSRYGGNKGDMSKTRPGKRDYEEKGEKITINGLSDLNKVIGVPKTMEELVSRYEITYNCQSNTKGMPTPEEIKRTADKVVTDNGGGDNDPVVGMMWILAGILIGLMVALCYGPGWSGYPYEQSDMTLKENINLVGKSKSGINIYEFDYINKKYGNGRYRGVMAQEVPSASIVGPEGTLMVDYSKLDVQFEKLNV
jgi:hypothetical protein